VRVQAGEVTVQALGRRFGARWAVRDLSFTLHPGSVTALLGPNGAGKTTTLRLLTGYLAPTTGTVQVAPFGYLPEGAPLYPEMTPHGLLAFVAQVRGLDEAAVARAIDQLDLATVRHQTIETLSKGTRRRVALAAALMHTPPVLILDEPTDGLDPNQKRAVRQLIRSRAPGTTVLLSTHSLDEVEALADRVLVLNAGQLVADDTPDGLKARGGAPARLEDVFAELTR
jgi:ABC-2 type transport system ATP-binding protein